MEILKELNYLTKLTITGDIHDSSSNSALSGNARHNVLLDSLSLVYCNGKSLFKGDGKL